MRALLVSVALMTVQLNSVSGQTKVVLDEPTLPGTPLVLVDTFRTDMNHLVLDPQKVDSINIFKNSAALLKFGDAGKFGVIIIYPKTYAKFLRVAKILDNYKISKEDKKLRICINKTLMPAPHLILIENSEIISVEITTDRHWINVEDANSGEKFINIITRTKDKTHS